MISIKSSKAVRSMEAASEILGGVFDTLDAMVQPGISTHELNETAEAIILKAGAVPSFKGYGGFPTTLCTSLNHQVVHGVPSREPLREGAILGVDVGCAVDGYHGDCAKTYAIGSVDTKAERLMRTTYESLFVGIAKARAGNRVGDISHAIQVYCERAGYSLIKALCGHGIGRELHEDPEVPNFGEAGRGARLRPGMTIAIEPMTAQGHWDVRQEGGFAYVTRDGSLSAHYEHTVLITEGDPVILTRWREPVWQHAAAGGG